MLTIYLPPPSTQNAHHLPPPSTQNAQPRTTLIILCEDGTLRIYVTNNSPSSQFWLQPDFQPTSPLAMLRSAGRKKVRPIQRGVEQPKFPVDFFENCQMLPYTDIDVRLFCLKLLRSHCTLYSNVHTYGNLRVTLLGACSMSVMHAVYCGGGQHTP